MYFLLNGSDLQNGNLLFILVRTQEKTVLSIQMIYKMSDLSEYSNEILFNLLLSHILT